ncbi:MAG: trigger factor [Lachnospiraceae bacterium]|nr:trigger factor [Lachnospiraceae bacterium]
MNKKLIRLFSTLLVLSLSACSTKSAISGTMPLGGVDYPAIFVKSGYYFDKASLSETVLADMLSKVTEVKKPQNLGTVEIPDLKTITLTATPKVEVDSTMIEAELEKEVDGETSYTAVKTKREAKNKDKVKIDFTGYVNGEKLEGGSGEDFDLVLGSGQFIPGFEEQVVGHAAGKRFKINVTFPENYDPTLAGKDAMFEIVIKAIEEPVTPEVNEEFVKKHTRSGSTTVDEYKEEVKQRIEKRNEFNDNQNLAYQLADKLFTEAKIEPTEEALAWQFSAMIGEYNKQAEQSGTNLSTMVAQSGQTMRSMYNEIKSYVPQVIQSTMLMDEMKKRYGKVASEADVMTWFDNMADALGFGNQVTYEDYKNNMGYDNLKNYVEQEGALISAIKHCNIVEENGELN